MIKIQVRALSQEFGNLIDSMDAVGKKSFPATADAFRYAVTKILLPIWKSVASGFPIKGGLPVLKSPSGGYAASIQVRQYSQFDWEVYSSAPVAEWLERGTKEVDFKKTHPFGRKSRVAMKKVKGVGERKVGYLIIPFRHHTPKARANPMPELIYRNLQNLIKKGEFKKSIETASAEKSGKYEPNFAGEMIPRATYSWGNRLRGLKVEFANLEGMVVFDTGSPKAVHSTYFTFRVISADSPAGSWIKPATRGLNITKAVWEASKEDVEKIIKAGLEKDLGL